MRIVFVFLLCVVVDAGKRIIHLTWCSSFKLHEQSMYHLATSLWRRQMNLWDPVGACEELCETVGHGSSCPRATRTNPRLCRSTWGARAVSVIDQRRLLHRNAMDMLANPC